MNDPDLQMVAEKMLRYDSMKNEPEMMFKLWSEHGNRTIVKKMREIVKEHVKAYHRDFYLCDMITMDNTGFKVPFLWFVRDTGTIMVVLASENTNLSVDVGYYMHGNNMYYVDPRTDTLIKLK